MITNGDWVEQMCSLQAVAWGKRKHYCDLFFMSRSESSGNSRLSDWALTDFSSEENKWKKMHFRAKGQVLTQSHWVNDELTYHISPSGPCILIWALLMHLRRQLGDQTLKLWILYLDVVCD